MTAIRFHGRGGQGAKTASRILGTAAFLEGFVAQDSPVYGPERRGAPVSAYTRIAKEPIRERGVIVRPDLVVVADPSLIADTAARVLEGIDELIRISREAGLPAEIYHLKASGKENWNKMDAAIAKVEEARAAGLRITADMYTYVAGATGLDATMPPWVQEGGLDPWIERLKDPAIRKTMQQEMNAPTDAWENMFLSAGPEGILLVGFRDPALRKCSASRCRRAAQLQSHPCVLCDRHRRAVIIAKK